MPAQQIQNNALRNKYLIASTALLGFLGAWLANPHTKTEQAIKNPIHVVELYKQPATANNTNKSANINLSFSKPAYANETSQYVKADQHLSEAEIIEIIQPILNSRAPSGKRPVLEKELKASKELLAQGLDLEQLVKEMQQPVEKTLEYSDIVYLTRDAYGNELNISHGSHLKKINENYRREVWNSDKPVLVLFYAGDFGKPSNEISPYNGLASVYKHIQEKFGDEIKFCAFKVSNEYYLDRWIKPFIREAYGAKTLPAILFYDNDRGEIEYDEQFIGGPCKVENWLKDYKIIKNYTQKNILD